MRNSLGFTLPVILAGLYFALLCAYVLTKKGKVTLPTTVFLLLLLIPIDALTDGRAGSSLTIALLVATFILNRLRVSDRKKFNICKVAAILSFVAATAISVFFAMYFDSRVPAHAAFNMSLTGRLRWWNLFYQNYGFSFLGQQVVRVGSAAVRDSIYLDRADMAILDNSILSILIEFGIVAFVVFALLFFALIKELQKSNDYTSLLIWTLFIVFGIVSNHLIHIQRNILLIQFSLILIPSVADATSKLFVKHVPSILQLQSV